MATGEILTLAMALGDLDFPSLSAPPAPSLPYQPPSLDTVGGGLGKSDKILRRKISYRTICT